MLLKKNLPVGAIALGACLIVSACGGEGEGQPATAKLTGIAVGEAPISGTVTVSDASMPVHQVTSLSGADGEFDVDVTGLTPPYLVSMAWQSGGATQRMYGAAWTEGEIELSPMSDATTRAMMGVDSDDDMHEAERDHGRRPSEERFRTTLTQLRQVLAPLFALYGVTGRDAKSRCGLAALFHDVSFGFSRGVLTVTNRATDAVIYSASATSLATGSVHPEAFPAGLTAGQCGSTGGGATCSSFTYSAWGACTNGTQTRTVVTSSPVGCTGGAPVLSQSCAVTPPTCSSFTYSAWGACTNGTQTRTVVTSSPAGCTGGAPVLSQSCIDGAALYTQYCSGCHGNSMKGKSASATQSAINRNAGGMGSLSFLTAAQIAAISAAP